MPRYNEDDLERSVNEESMRQWRHPAEMLDADSEEVALASRLADVLTPVFLFISKGRVGGTMHLRAWVCLYATRRDLVDGDTIDAFAKRTGVSANRIHSLVKEFAASVPGYRIPGRKTAAQVAAMRAAAMRRWGGRGKESFSRLRTSAGSDGARSSTRRGK